MPVTTRPFAFCVAVAVVYACSSDAPEVVSAPTASGGSDAGSDAAQGDGGASAGGTGSAAASNAGAAGSDAGAGGEGGHACCGCLCRDPAWSCSNDTCLDEHGHAIGLAPEAGFFQIEGESYVSEGMQRNSPRHRVWYAFQPAATTPEDKPLAVLFNGGPGSATTVLFGFNTNRFTLDPDLTQGEAIAENPAAWTSMANLLYIDAPATGFSYALPMPSGLGPTVGIDLDRDAASFLRVVMRFLERHPALRDNPILLVGESYGGTRATLMLEHLFHYDRLVSAQAAYRDPPLYAELVAHFAAVFPELDPTALGPAEIAQQFGTQILLQPAVAGQTQWDLNVPDTSVCAPNFDDNQCDEPTGWFKEQVAVVADRMTTIATLRQALGVDPTTIAWLYAAERKNAYGRTMGQAADPTEMTAVFGELGIQDNYYLADNREVRDRYDGSARFWDDPLLGDGFLENTFYVRTFISDARLDTLIWTPAIPPALAAYTNLLTSSVYDNAPRADVARLGWISLDYRADVFAAPTTREIRFPHYESAGHAVTLRASTELLADVSAWLWN